MKSYSQKLAAYDNLQRKSEAPFLKRFGIGGAIIFMLLIGAFVFSYLGGRAQAMNQDEFYIPSTHPNSIILRIYGDKLICANFDEERREIKREYFILKANEQPIPVLISTKTGRLYVD